MDFDERKWGEDIETFCLSKYVSPVFFALGGSHSHGYDIPQSDIDIRGVYLAPTYEVLTFGVSKSRQTLVWQKDNVDIELHEAGKFVTQMIKPNLNFMSVALSIKTSFYGTDIQNRFAAIAEKCVSRQLIPGIDGVAYSCKKVGKRRQAMLAFLYLRGYVMLRTGKILIHMNDFEFEGCVFPEIKDPFELFVRAAHGETALYEQSAVLAERAWDEIKDTTKIPEEVDRGQLRKWAGDLLVDLRQQEWNGFL